jgi:hypothetical protein
VDLDYRPAVPLNASIRGVSEALAPVPDQLDLVERELTTAADNIETIGDDVRVLAGDMGAIETNLRRTAAVAAAYRQTVSDVQAGVAFLGDNIRTATRIARLLALALLAWALIAQIGLFTHGWELWRRGARDCTPSMHA